MAEEPLTYHFEPFVLDWTNRQLLRDHTPVDLSGRYLDALLLLVRSPGQLVTKDQFFEEVWSDVVVSDSALTQCIKAIRKQLGDNATDPRFIETVPRYGYRFIGTVTTDNTTQPERATELEESPALQPLDNPLDTKAAAAPVSSASQSIAHNTPTPASAEIVSLGAAPSQHPARMVLPFSLRQILLEGTAGTVGGSVAGVLGGLLYGFGLSTSSTVGVASLLLVLLSLNVLVGTIGGLGVSFGMAIAGIFRPNPTLWRIVGAGLGGLFVGGLVKLLSLDAFTLLFGNAPADITGGLEGATLGAAIALGAYIGTRESAPWWRPAVAAGLTGCGAGLLIPLAGGRLMGGSLELLARSFANSRLELDAMGRFFGEVTFGPTTNVFLGGLEGLTFGICVVGAIAFARQTWPLKRSAVD